MTESLYSLVKEACEKNRGRIALENGTMKITYGRFLEDINRAAACLRGVAEEGTSAVFCHTGLPSSPAAVCAADKAGIDPVFTSGIMSPAEFADMAKNNDCKLAFMTPFHLRKYQSVLKSTPVRTVILSRFDDYLNLWDRIHVRVAELVKNDAMKRDVTASLTGIRILNWKDIVRDEMPEDKSDFGEERRFVFLRGGATGTHHAFEADTKALYWACTKGIEILDYYKKSSRIMSCLDMCFSFGLCWTFATILSGRTLLLSARESLNLDPKDVVFYKPDIVIGYPGILYEFLDYNGSSFSFLSGVISCGDLMHSFRYNELKNYFAKRNPEVKITRLYGIVETMMAFAVNYPDSGHERSAGKPLPGVSIRISDRDTFDELPAGTRGEICVACPSVMKGYQYPGNNDDVIKVSADGTRWLRTGDAGYVDEDGFIMYEGTYARIIDVGGLILYPATVESAIRNVMGVSEVCVTGIDNDGEQMVVAAVVPEDRIMFDGDKLDKLKSDIEEECEMVISEPFRPDRIIFKAYLPGGEYGQVDMDTLEQELRESLTL
ncbi:MAG: acyl--CoA ligase [Clostridiales bacterium]|nr:acyl--CoA ligase [Clostridiales bacterium]